jgi:hypothetical protein
MCTRRLIWLLMTSLALAATSEPAVAKTHTRPNPNPNPLWRVYPLGTQPLVKDGAGRATAGTGRDSNPATSSTNENKLIGFTQIVVGTTAMLCALVAVVPIAVQRRRSQPRHIAAVASRRPAAPTRGHPAVRVEYGAAGAIHRQVPPVNPSPSATSQPAARTSRGPADCPSLTRSRDLLADERLQLADPPTTSQEESIEPVVAGTPVAVEAQPARSTRPTATPDEAILLYASLCRSLTTR